MIEKVVLDCRWISSRVLNPIRFLQAHEFDLVESFSKDVNRVSIGANKIDLYCAIIYFLPREVRIYFKMLGFVIEDWTFGNLDITLVVTPQIHG